jgi:hypothetical protein
MEEFGWHVFQKDASLLASDPILTSYQRGSKPNYWTTCDKTWDKKAYKGTFYTNNEAYSFS